MRKNFKQVVWNIYETVSLPNYWKKYVSYFLYSLQMQICLSRSGGICLSALLRGPRGSLLRVVIIRSLWGQDWLYGKTMLCRAEPSGNSCPHVIIGKFWKFSFISLPMYNPLLMYIIIWESIYSYYEVLFYFRSGNNATNMCEEIFSCTLYWWSYLHIDDSSKSAEFLEFDG